jgi:hypothetical protein
MPMRFRTSLLISYLGKALLIDTAISRGSGSNAELGGETGTRPLQAYMAAILVVAELEVSGRAAVP